jgi:8-oxo-dGTP pyrophosphatase MutT (NUDIX family)
MKIKRLPPDPENMNDERADWADAAIQEFMEETGVDLDGALCDLLADLAHWADRNEQDFRAQLARAADHYYAETSGKGKQLDGTDGRDVALVYDGDANARLIAAAPELYSALEYCFDRLEVLEDADEATALDLGALRAAREALTKARGEGV